jgi:hypothetical protein
MKISEILVESKQLDEGPLLNKIGSAVGKGVGTVAKGIGSVAGGVVGAGKAIAKGYRAGKAAVASAGDSDDALPTPNSGDYGQLSKDKGKIWNKKSQAWEPYDQSTGATPAAGAAGAAAPAPGAAGAAPSNAPQAAGAAPAPAAGAAPTAQQINKAGPKGTAVAKAQTGKAGQALAKTGAALAGQDQTQAGQTMYAQVKANVDKLDKKGKQRIMQLLQKSLGTLAAAPAAAPAPKLGVAPTMSTVTKNWDAETGEPLTPKAKAEYAKFSPEQKAEIEKNKAARKPAKPTQAEIDADRERIMGSNSGESTVRTGKVVAESFSLYRKQ